MQRGKKGGAGGGEGVSLFTAERAVGFSLLQAEADLCQF